MSQIVTKGFYVHYKGGIYFVHKTATSLFGEPIVIYESVQGCGDDVSKMSIVEGQHYMEVDKDHVGTCYRKLAEFIQEVDWTTGLTDDEAFLKNIVNQGQMIPRFQRVVGWREGRPLVLANDKDTMVVAFSPQYGQHYEEGE
jgi:hypothetical protein